MSRAILEVEALDAWYGAARILTDLSFELRSGEVLALLGRNGAGKTTTLRAVVGLVARRRGRIRIADREVAGLPPYRVARLGIGFVPEDRRIFSGLTVQENLEVGRQPPRAGVPVWSPERLFGLFPALAGLRHRPAGRISGGEQQMLAIARTLMGNPAVLLLDEPAEGLAPRVVDHLAETLRGLKGEGLALLLSEQNLAFAGVVADRVCILEQGRVLHHGTMAALLADPTPAHDHLAL
ncbi:MAG: ATP-binding cassette domain-containing protein [Azospirillum sp.]|nr:ATP-binding cassette domain-containing protein [Azospirillum sp.]